MRFVNEYDVVVVGAGQAGLSAAYALAKAGLDRERYVVLDANSGPGGAWRHRWPSLTLGAARLTTRTLINATGTWDRPYWPYYPGRATFRGRQLHTHDNRSAEDFRGQNVVVVVGGGTSAVQFLLQLDAAGATTTWVTRRPPEFTKRPFDEEWGRDVEAAVNAALDRPRNLAG